MEVYFADVGQGSCNVILIGGRRALVIDTGRRASDLRLLLNHLSIDNIPVLAISHLDIDHSGGAPAILTEFRGRIGRVCYPNDHRGATVSVMKKIGKEMKSGHLRPDQLVRLEYQKKPKVIWRSPALKAELKLFSPSFAQNQNAMLSGNANATSGVLVLKVGTQRIVFPGDSSLEQWKEIRNLKGSAVECEIIAVPHHAGMIWQSGWANTKIVGELQAMYQDMVKAKYAVISAGTSNSEGHPRADVMETLKIAGVRIICTQITKQCCDDLEKVRPGVIPLIAPGRSQPTKALTSSKNSRDVACGGTVIADITDKSTSIRRLSQHATAIGGIPTTSTSAPLCV